MILFNIGKQCVCGGDFSYNILPLDGDETFYEWVNSKDFYIERDWYAVVNKEVIFIFSNIL